MPAPSDDVSAEHLERLGANLERAQHESEMLCDAVSEQLVQMQLDSRIDQVALDDPSAHITEA
jgi:hypothetical protein